MKRSIPRPGSVSPPLVKRKIESTTTNKAVASFFKPASQRERENLVWRTVENSLIIGRYDVTEQTPQQRTLPVKVAAFDLDDTLITAKDAGKTWNRSAVSWRWWNTSVPGKLKSLHNDGYLVVIFSNQSTISLKDNKKSLQKDMVSLINFKSQLSSILQQLDIPVSIYAATGQDKYRKPRIGMWEELLEDHDLKAGGAIDMESSFYIGDAAGREKTDRRRKDHATSDRDLAANIGINFKTPEEFFLGMVTEPYEQVFEPATYLATKNTAGGVLSEPAPIPVSAPFVKNDMQELVIFCGSPGAGKSTFYWNVLEPLGYERVNQDILKTRQNCIRRARDLLETGLSVAVDNTNRDVKTRSQWVQVAQEFNIPIRCVRFTASTRLAEHNDAVRALNPNLMNPENRTQLPAIAFHSFLQAFEEPILAEGFRDIYRVDFEFKGTEEQRKLWSRYWVSKYST